MTDLNPEQERRHAVRDFLMRLLSDPLVPSAEVENAYLAWDALVAENAARGEELAAAQQENKELRFAEKLWEAVVPILSREQINQAYADARKVLNG